MSTAKVHFGVAGLLLAIALGTEVSADPAHPRLTWVKRHPREADQGKPSPRMGYETSYGYDSLRRLLIRHAGHNQGGGGEQNAEVWTYDLAGDVWTLREPNDAPPGTCCAQQNVFDEALRQFVRFPAFSGSHGWQSPREIGLKDSSVWTYELDTNIWRAMRPCPEVWPSPLRGAAYDLEHQVIVLHGGEGSSHGTVAYDLFANRWHELKPEVQPPASISQPGFAYDAVNQLCVLFGSQFADDPRTWVYDLRANRWEVLEVGEHPPADKSCPVMAADTRNGIILCSVLGSGGHETWVLDVAKRQWTRLRLDREPDLSGARNRVLLYLPDDNLFVLENRTSQEQQIWTFRYAESPPPVVRMRELRASTGPKSARLAWQAPPGPGPLHYTVYRAQGPTPWQVDLQPIAKDLTVTTYEDLSLRPGEVYYYQVRAAHRSGREVARSWIVRTQPPVVRDLTVSVLDSQHVELAWRPIEAEDVVGYHVERADVSVYSSEQVLRIRERYRAVSDQAVGRIKQIGAFRRLTQSPLAMAQFVDDQVDLAAGQREPTPPLLAERLLRTDQFHSQGRPYRWAVYAYRVIAVNRLGVESGPSPLRFTYPSAVQYVFAHEEGDQKTHLKWQANPEKGIRGYLVYRQDGRWDKDPISRLTADPIPQTQFTDETAGRDTRRYEVVAVDALGQEGEPSQPVWSRREWWRFYVPYTSEWHQ